MTGLSIHPAVADDIAEIVAFIAADNPAAAKSVSDAIYDQFLVLRSHPKLGVSFRTGIDKLEKIRMFPVPRFRSYLIFYTPHARGIRILYVSHSSRNIREQMADEVRD